jgi:hypothetical protein
MLDKREFMRLALSRSKRFGAPSPIVPFADWDYYYLLTDLQWTPDVIRPGLPNRVDVPRGFVTDLASIPRIFWSALPPASSYTYPAIVHDYLYWYQPCERAEADDAFRVAMTELNVAPTKVAAIYNAVRSLGATSWENNASARDKGEHRLLIKYPTDVKTTWSDWKAKPDVFGPRLATL